MSIQLLREPLRSIRQQTSIKPWPFLSQYNHSTKLLIQPIPPLSRLSQGKIPPSSKWPLILVTHRSYSSAAAVRSLTPTTVTKPDPDTITPLKPTKPRKSTNTSRSLWTDYQHKLNHAKDTLNVEYFDRLLTLLLDQAPNSKKSVAWSRITEAFETANSLKVDITPNMYLSAVTAYGRLNNVQLVTSTFQAYKRRFRVKRGYAYPRYLAAVLDCGELSQALDLFRNVKSNPSLGIKDASLCLALLVPAYCQSNRKTLWQLALKVTDELDSVGHWPVEARTQITQAIWEACLKSIKSPIVEISPQAAESLVSNYLTTATSNNKRHSQHLFTLFRLLCHHQGFVPTAKTCNWILETQLNEGHSVRAKAILQWMQRFRLEPDSTTISLLLSTFGDQLPLQQRKALYDMLPSDDINMYKAFIKVFSTSISDNDLTQVMAVVSDMKQRGFDLDSSCYSSMAQGFVKRNQVDKGWDWLVESNCTDLDSYAVIMEAWLSRGQWQKCVQHYDSLSKQYTHVNTNRRLVKALLTAQFADSQFQAADTLLSKTSMKFTSTTVFRVLNTLLNLETVRGHPLVSGTQIVKAAKMMESRLHVHLTAEGISRIITRLGQRGYGSSGFQLYNWVREGTDETSRKRCASASLYYAMMACATNTNDTRVLERAWVDMQYRKQYTTEGCTTKELHGLSSYNILLNGYASRLPRPDLTRVRRSFARMLKQNLSPDLVTYNIMIKAFVSANNMEAAFQIYKKLKSDDLKPDAHTVNTLLNGWIIRKDWSHVEKFMDELKNTGNLDMVTFNLLVQSFLQLDSKTMNYQHILKQQNKWKDLKQSQACVPMSTEKIWSVIESTTGYSKSAVLDTLGKQPPKLSLAKTNTSLCNQLVNLQTQPRPSANIDKKHAFVTLFSKNQEPDEVTYKLFMKAFVNAGDFKSAHLVYKWMQYRLNNPI